ncbi:MAG: hypothetical protein Q9169_000187 [Polycauliona sp. 2 TL-2023]
MASLQDVLRIEKERQAQSSPIGSSAATKPQSRKVSCPTVPKNMGLRAIEEQMSKLQKQNFDLKLETHHHRQRTEALEMKAAKAGDLETQNAELRRINDEQRLELDMRELAIGEAASAIRYLHAKITRLESQQQRKNRPVAPIENQHANTEVREDHQLLGSTSIFPSSSSVKSSGSVVVSTGQQILQRYCQEKEARLLRSPSSLNNDKPSTTTPRDLFQSHDLGSTANGYRPTNTSVLSLDRAGSPFSQNDFAETTDEDHLSPLRRQLSLLSESSFVSVYGLQKDEGTPDVTPKMAAEANSQNGKVHHWIEHKDHPASPSKFSTTSVDSDPFFSIAKMLKPNRPTSRKVPHLASPPRSTAHHQHNNQHNNPQRYEKSSTKPSIVAPTFGSNALPPTPGTMSSATLGGKSSDHSMIVDKSTHDGASRPTTAHMSCLSHQRSNSSEQNGVTKSVKRVSFEDDTDCSRQRRSFEDDTESSRQRRSSIQQATVPASKPSQTLTSRLFRRSPPTATKALIFSAWNGEQRRASLQPQSKRLSVSSIGRSASMKIKEGLGRKK